jgi:G3E family GTPase
VTVVDAFNFHADFRTTDTLQDREQSLGVEDERDLVALLVDQVEFADVLILNKCDLLSDPELQEVEGMLRGLNATAPILRAERGRVPLTAILDTKRFDFDRASESPGWKAVLRGQEHPETAEYGITSFVYRARMPFHPARLWDVLNDQSLTVGLLRSKGFVWIVTRPMWVGVWSQAGRVMELSPAAAWWADTPREDWPTDAAERADIESQFAEPFGDRRQELVFIGKKLDEPTIRAALDEALMTDAEMIGGQAFWNTIHDPLPLWPDSPPAHTH